MEKFLSALLALLLLLPPAAARAQEPIRFLTVRDVTARIAVAQDVTLSAYTISPRGIMARALLQDTKHGGHVHVVLDGHAFGAAQHANLATGLELRQAGVRVEYTQEPLHMKAALVDGLLYLSDRNWTSKAHAEIVLEDDVAADRPIVLRAIAGAAGYNEHLWTRKGDALAAEAHVLNGNAAHDVCIETESFGAGTPVYDALLARRKRGDRVRLLVASLELRSKKSSPEQTALDHLAAAGVEVRVGSSGEKIALDGNNGWLGSANATRGLADQIDWGMTTNAEMTAALRQRFETNWNARSSHVRGAAQA